MNIDGLKIEVLLAKAGITKTELASRLRGFAGKTFSTIVRRGTCAPHTLGKLAAGLGVPVSELVGGEKPC